MSKLYTRDKSDNELIEQFIKSGLQDRTFEKEFHSECANTRAQRLWEAVLYDYLKFVFGADRITSKEAGPDFKINMNGKTIWVEAISPVMEGIQCQEFNNCDFESGNISIASFDSQLLRWTGGLKDKGITKYNKIYNRVVKDDPFVIAISDMTASNPFSFNGIDEIPYFLKAVFPIGHQISTNAGVITEKRLVFKKQNGADIDSGVFLSKEYQPVSGVLAFDKAFSFMHFAYNPMAVTPISSDIFPSHFEYGCNLSFWGESYID